MKGNGTGMLGIKIDKELMQRLDRYKETHGVSKTFIIKKALEKYMDELEKMEKD